MPPVRAWRVDYADGTSWHDTDGWPPPDRGVLAIVEFHDPPYRSFYYGRMGGYTFRDATLTGAEIDDDAWERYRLALHAEPHPLEE